MTAPETRYARSGDIHVAYQVVGEGPVDVVYVSPGMQHVEHIWESPPMPAPPASAASAWIETETERSHHGSAIAEPDFARRMELAGLEPATSWDSRRCVFGTPKP